MNDPRTLVSHPELHSHHSFPLFSTVGERPKSLLERTLSLFADVRAGEGVGAVLMAVTVFLLLGGYYLLKTVREALILTEGGAEVKAYSSAAQALLLLGVVPLYSWLSSKVGRLPLMATTSTFFAVNLVLFFLAGQSGARIGIAFYIWLGIFNVFVISQFWAFANDIYTEGQGRRLFPLIGVGSSLGAWLGAEASVPLVQRLASGPYAVLLVTAGLLLVCLGLMVVVNTREARRQPETAAQGAQPLTGAGGFALVMRDRYLLWIAMLVLLLNVVNSAGEFILGSLVVDEAARAFADPAQQDERLRFVGTFYGSFYGNVNLLSFLVQLFVTSRLIRYLGVRGSLFVLPVLALVSYSVMAVAPLLGLVKVLKTLENSTNYSLQNTVREALFLPTTRDAKYKAKAAIDTFFMRAGDVAQAGVVRAGTALGASVGAFAWFTVGLTVLWLWVAGRIAREHRRRTV
jgi:AAA family ATP:ADP antiporter